MKTQNYYVVKLIEFTEYPGPGKAEFGNFSGEEFLEKKLWPAYQNARSKGQVLFIDMDGTAGFGTSFARESILGLIKRANSRSIHNEIIVKIDEIRILDELIQSWLQEGIGSTKLAA